MAADKKVYDQIDESFYLKRKITVDNVVYQGKNGRAAPLYTNAAAALKESLGKAGMLASEERAPYVLNGYIKDVGVPSCFFGTCETGAAIEYTLTDTKKDKIVYEELLVVPYMSEYPIMGADMNVVMRSTVGGAVGENYAHLIHVLSDKTQKELQ